MFIFLCTYGALSVSSITWVMQSTKGKWRCASQRMFLTLICVCRVHMYPRKLLSGADAVISRIVHWAINDIVHSTEPHYCIFVSVCPDRSGVHIQLIAGPSLVLDMTTKTALSTCFCCTLLNWDVVVIDCSHDLTFLISMESSKQEAMNMMGGQG